MVEHEMSKGVQFGAFLVENGFISPGELEAALILQHDRHPKIGRLAQRRSLLTFPKIRQILEHQSKTRLPFGAAAIDLGFLSELEVEALIDEQSSQHVRLGELLVELHLLTPGRLQQCLETFFSRYPNSKRTFESSRQN